MRPDLAKQIHGVGDAGKDLLPVKPSWPSHAAAKSYHDLIVSPEAIIGPRGIDRRIMDYRIPFLVALTVPWNLVPVFHHCSSYLKL